MESKVYVQKSQAAQQKQLSEADSQFLKSLEGLSLEEVGKRISELEKENKEWSRKVKDLAQENRSIRNVINSELKLQLPKELQTLPIEENKDKQHKKDKNKDHHQKESNYKDFLPK